MRDSSDEKEAEIARLLAELADLSGENAALEACRREAAAFDPALCAAAVARDLLALETEAADRKAIESFLDELALGGRRP